MPHFDEYGGDQWICQKCGGIFDSRDKSEWRPDITGCISAGNVCPCCVAAYKVYYPEGKEKERRWEK